MKTTIIFFSLLMASLVVSAQNTERQLVDKIVGIVGNEVILLSDIELEYQRAKYEEQNVEEDYKCTILESFLSQKLFLEQAVVDSIVVGEDEVEGELNRRVDYFVQVLFQGDVKKMEEEYGKSILEIKDDFREDIREQLLSQRMQGEIFSGLTVTPSEVKSFYNSIPKDSLPYFNAEIEMAQVVIFPKISDAQDELARAKISSIREQIVNGGESFGTKAIVHSKDKVSAEKLGSLGWIGRGQMVPEFEAVVYRLDSGEVSKPFKTDFGYHIATVDQIRGNQRSVRHILIIPEFSGFEIEQAQRELDSIRTLIVIDSMKFEQAVYLHSEDEETKYNAGKLTNPTNGSTYFELSELGSIPGTDEALSLAVANLEVGEVSKPNIYQTQRGKIAIRILVKLSETTPHQANLKDDYPKIKQAALNEKQQKQLISWVEDRIEQNYVKVDPKYKSCPNMAKWYKTNDVIISKYE